MIYIVDIYHDSFMPTLEFSLNTEIGSRISDAKLTYKSLKNGSTERTRHVWQLVEQMTPRIGARAKPEVEKWRS